MFYYVSGTMLGIEGPESPIPALSDNANKGNKNKL